MKSKSQHENEIREAPKADGASAVETSSAETATATCESSELQAKISSLEDSLLRAKADLQNVQRRAASERSEAVRFANAELMKSLLDVVDDFDRTLTAAESSEDTQTMRNGVKLIHTNLKKALRDFGLETIEARGKKFDPAIHEALMQQPTKDAEPGTVLEQVAGGYKLRDRVLRPARVVVATAPEKTNA
ncbi:MAG: nucleotide exchange factor GrpE [Planctomycetes bacterium]|nr:nucleotide exchange factor GrpE [Planctomycetota bacterium]MBI3834196.1 nucleotide exchange factor GrpE [Planctomycetota bacterium]